MIRFFLFATGRIDLSVPLILSLLSVFLLESIIRNTYADESSALLFSFLAVIVYVGGLCSSLGFTMGPSIKDFIKFHLSKLGYFYLNAYCFSAILIGITIPGSSFIDQICGSADSFCLAKTIGFELLVCIWGISALIDFVDLRRLVKS